MPLVVGAADKRLAGCGMRICRDIDYAGVFRIQCYQSAVIGFGIIQRRAGKR